MADNTVDTERERIWVAVVNSVSFFRVCVFPVRHFIRSRVAGCRLLENARRSRVFYVSARAVSFSASGGISAGRDGVPPRALSVEITVNVLDPCFL